MLQAGRVSRFACLLVCLLVEFDLFLAFGVLACRILDCASCCVDCYQISCVVYA